MLNGKGPSLEWWSECEVDLGAGRKAVTRTLDTDWEGSSLHQGQQLPRQQEGVRNGYLLPPGPESLKKAIGGGGQGWRLGGGGNLETDSQNQGWKGFRGTFSLFPSLWAKFRIKHLIISGKVS